MPHSSNSPTAAELPAAPGTYALIMRLAAPATIQVGQLGAFCFAAGVYAYIGSAHGPGGLRARLARHLRAEKKRHWHIDYLAEHTTISEVWAAASAERLECAWANTLGALPGVEQCAPRFGASDCACPAHLFWLPERALFDAWRALAKPLRVVIGQG